MAITIYTEEEISNQALAFLRNRFPGRDSSRESFLGKVARSFGMLASGIQKSALDADNDSVPSTKNSTEALEYFAYVFGVPSSTAGTYGRKEGTAAGGGVALCTGTNGTTFTAGDQLLAPDGVTYIELESTVSIAGSPPGNGSISGDFNAVTLGTVGNLEEGTLLTWVTPPSGADPTVTLTTELSDGLDEETDQALLSRILVRLQQPPKGGTASDYRQWAEAVTGILRAYVYPVRGGMGTAHVVITGPGSGTDRDPGATLKTTVDDYIDGSSSEEGTRPVTNQGYRSYRPYQPGSGLEIRVRVVPNGTSNAFDWDDSGTALTVLSYTPGSPAELELSSLPATLSAAITAGDNPRLQVFSTGAGAPTNVQVRAESIVGGTTVALEDPLPADFVAPVSTNQVYAGGPVVDTIAAALLDYVDSLGPSKESGYADTLDDWEDTVAIARLGQVTLDQVDASDRRLCTNLIAGGVTIDGGTDDVQATDDSSNGPELLFARWIEVTQ
jgi:uncharacterized phage protein gp47/JayE